jgi:GGDEF domain-containing protein
MMKRTGLTRLRLSVVLLLFWLTALYNIERIHEPINLASFVYVLVAVQSVFVICSPQLRRATLMQFTAANFVFYAALKAYLGYPFFGANLPITVTECVVIGVTNLLAWAVASDIDDFMRSASDIASVQFGRRPISLHDGEVLMYNEVQRARRFQRKLSLATVRFNREMRGQEFDRLLEKVRHVLVQRYVESRVGSLLMDAASPGDLVVVRDDEFVVVCPEMSEQDLRGILTNVSDELQRELGIKIQAGISEFPSNECTLTGLIERADSQMAWLGTSETTIKDPLDVDLASKNNPRETLEC